MRRFSTPVHRFESPFNTDVVKKLVLTYEQNRKIILKKTEADLTADGKSWSIVLSQRETAMFAPGVVTAEIHFLTEDGESGHIGPATLYVEDVQHKEVLA